MYSKNNAMLHFINMIAEEGACSFIIKYSENFAEVSTGYNVCNGLVFHGHTTHTIEAI